VPIQLEIDQENRLITAVLSGRISVEEILGATDKGMVANAFAFAKLVDFGTATADLNDDDLRMIGARFQAYLKYFTGPKGPFAMVASTETGQNRARMIAALSAAERPVRVFPDVASARKWLARTATPGSTAAVG
jgi:hypothetical protein